MSAKEPELLFSSDDDDPMDEVVKKNTMANSLSKIINHDKPVEDETNLEDSDNSENSENSESSESDSEGTHDDSIASVASIDADLSDAEADADADADAVLNIFSKQKNKRIKSKPKPTLQDITSLEQSYQDMSEDSESNNDSGDDDNENENDTDENYLQKFDDLLRETHMKNHHPEMLDNNVDEIESLVRVVRNSDGIIVDALHKTSPFLTKYEKTRILGVRAKQINQGAKPLIEIEKNIIDGYLIAQLELQKKVIPFIIKRPIPNGNFEFWKLSDLEII